MPAPDVGISLDKVAHFTMFAVMGALAARGWRRSDRRHPALLPLLLVCAIGAADELHQRSVPGRSSEAADWIADIAGGITGFAIVARSTRRTHRTARTAGLTHDTKNDPTRPESRERA